MTIVVQRRAPALPSVPPVLVGKLVVAVATSYAGPIEDGERVVRPLSNFRDSGARPVPAQAVPGPAHLEHRPLADGGAAARVGEDETAFKGCDAEFNININGNAKTADRFEAERGWARGYWSALAPYHKGVYVNFLMEEGEERVRSGLEPVSATGSPRQGRRTGRSPSRCG
jgi:hypothetical protein